MKISVVSPVFNIKAEYLEKSINSILNQTYKPYEIIIVDDGSTRQETLDCLEEFKKNERLTIIHQVNKKTCGALNTGIIHMTGDWWAGLSSDDMWLPYKLEKQIEFFEKHPIAKVIYADWQTIGVDDVIGDPHYVEPVFETLDQQQQFVMGSYFGMWSNMLVHKSVFDKVGIFNEEFIACEDYEMLVRISQFYLYHKVSEVLTQYRIHEEQTTQGDYGFQGKIGKKFDAQAHRLAYQLFKKG